MARAARFGPAIAIVFAGCQWVAGYDDFTPPAESTGEPDVSPCAAIEEPSKPDTRGTTLMVLVESASDRCLWVDRTEVTVAAYDDFLTDVAGAFDWSSTDYCKWKTAASDPARSPEDPCFEQATAMDQDAFASGDPIRCVDWCDADAYCSWAGKHLCYAYVSQQLIGLTTPMNVDDWAYACSGPEQASLPYGQRAEANVCNVEISSTSCLNAGGIGNSCAPAAASSFDGCGYAGGPINMIGNVSEWIATCFDQGIAEETCHVRGGSFDSALDEATCFTQYVQWERQARRPEVGFRCCEELTKAEEALVTAP